MLPGAVPAISSFIIAAIIAPETAMKTANEPSSVAAPMSMPRIC